MERVGKNGDRAGRTRITVGITVGVAVALVATVILIPKIYSRLVTNGTLALASGVYDICYQPPTPADWTAQARYGLAYGLDVLTLSSSSAHVTVTSVTMVRPTPGFELLSVALIPSAGVGLGSPGNRDWPVSDARLLPLVQSLPAKVRAMPEIATALHLPDDAAREWTLAVKVRVPAATVNGHVDGFLVSYRTGSRTKSLRTKDTLTLGTGKNICTP